jgi:lipid II:glycine glycyltransferase (peptidoglycan interpeptide bridge formation enzyme)
MQSYAWGQFQRELGWGVQYCVSTEGAEIRGAALLLHRSLPGTGRKVFYAPRGPAIDITDQAPDTFIAKLGDAIRQQGAIFLRCDPYWTEVETQGRDPLPQMTRVPRDWSYWNAPRFVFWLNLEGDEDALMKRLTSGCRNEVRKGAKSGVVFTLGTDSDFPGFHRLMTLTGNQKGIAFQDPEYYMRLLTVVNASARVQLFVGRHDGQVVTAGVSVAYGKKAWLLYAASDPAHYKLRANRTQQWEMLRWAQSLGCERYDFRGTATNDPPSKDDPGYGVYEFKKSFGPTFTRLTGYYDLIQRPALYRLFRLAEEYGLPAAYKVKTWLQR